VGLVLAAIACAAPHSTPAPPPAFHSKPCVTSYRVAAECGTVTVFEDRAASRGRTIDLNVVVVRAASPGSRDAVTTLSGGPGEGATSAAGAADGWLAPIHERMDLLFVDQRGTGQSNPLMCQPAATASPSAVFGHVFDPAAYTRCRAELEAKADLTKYTTDLAAADLDDVRAAVGYERLSLFGGSYGTRMAQAYMRRFPTHTRSVVIDGVVPFDVNVPLSYARSGQQALDRLFAASGAPTVAAEFNALLRRFDAGPIAVTVQPRTGPPARVEMTRGDFAYAVRGLLYRANAARTLPGVISRAARSGSLDEFARAYYEREVAFEADLAYGMHLSVFCAEDVPFATEAEIESATTGTFMGRYLFDEYRNACHVWPRGAIAADARAPVTARVPTLLVSGFFDPVTPPEFADRVAQSLPVARTIVAPLGAHGSALGCARAAVLYVLLNGTLADAPDACR
jgi:pimeloyl-ACP methyl ester carboxylesterase